MTQATPRSLRRLVALGLLLSGLSSIYSRNLDKQGSNLPKAELIERCEGGCSGYDHIMETTLTLHIKSPAAEFVALRVCSKLDMPLALATSVMRPDAYANWMVNIYSFTPKQILFLRSEDCLGSDSNITAAELWAVPKGAALPPYVEAVESCRYDSVFLGKRRGKNALPFEGAVDYRAALRRLIAELRANPKAAGAAFGFVLERPTSVLKRRMTEAEETMKQSGLPQNRYIVQMRNWDGEYGIDPPDPKPKYPSVFLFKIAENCAHK